MQGVQLHHHYHERNKIVTMLCFRLTVQKTKERVLRQMSSAKKDKKLNHARTLDSINNEERIRNKYYLKDKFEQAAKRSRHDPPYHGYNPYSNRGPEVRRFIGDYGSQIAASSGLWLIFIMNSFNYLSMHSQI